MKKAENMDIEVDEDLYDVICLIAEKIKDNIRELEGAFIRIVSFSHLLNEKPDKAFAKRILRDILINNEMTITPEKSKRRFVNTTISRWQIWNPPKRRITSPFRDR